MSFKVARPMKMSLPTGAMVLWRCAHALLVLSVLCMKALVLLYAANAVLVLTLDPPCSDEEALKSIEKLVCINSFRNVQFENLI